MSGQSHAPVALTRAAGIQCTGGWVEPTDVLEKSKSLALLGIEPQITQPIAYSLHPQEHDIQYNHNIALT